MVISTGQTDQNKQVSQREEAIKLPLLWYPYHLPHSSLAETGLLFPPPHLTQARPLEFELRSQGRHSHHRKTPTPGRVTSLSLGGKTPSVGIKAFTSWPSTRQVNNWREFLRQKAKKKKKGYSLSCHKQNNKSQAGNEIRQRYY